MEVYLKFQSLMQQGGPVMWVIFVAACIAMFMLILQGIQLMRLIKYAKEDYSMLMTQRDIGQLLNSDISISPVSQLLRSINLSEINTKDELIKDINTHLAEIMPRLEGTLPTVAIIGTLLPMLGLLGTVTGMIKVFEVIAVHGTGDPGEMAQGISQALLTTASGLIIAIPVIFVHHVLSRRLNILVAITQQAIQLVLHRLPLTQNAKAMP